jgi:hypothetical protein
MVTTDLLLLSALEAEVVKVLDQDHYTRVAGPRQARISARAGCAERQGRR